MHVAVSCIIWIYTLSVLFCIWSFITEFWKDKLTSLDHEKTLSSKIIVQDLKDFTLENWDPHGLMVAGILGPIRFNKYTNIESITHTFFFTCLFLVLLFDNFSDRLTIKEKYICNVYIYIYKTVFLEVILPFCERKKTTPLSVHIFMSLGFFGHCEIIKSTAKVVSPQTSSLNDELEALALQAVAAKISTWQVLTLDPEKWTVGVNLEISPILKRNIIWSIQFHDFGFNMLIF